MAGSTHEDDDDEGEDEDEEDADDEGDEEGSEEDDTRTFCSPFSLALSTSKTYSGSAGSSDKSSDLWSSSSEATWEGWYSRRPLGDVRAMEKSLGAPCVTCAMQGVLHEDPTLLGGSRVKSIKSPEVCQEMLAACLPGILSGTVEKPLLGFL